MVQVNLRNKLYDEAIKRGFGTHPGITKWINNIAEMALFPKRAYEKSQNPDIQEEEK